MPNEYTDDRSFNTWLEAYSMLDPEIQESNPTIGGLTLSTMRRTFHVHHDLWV